jgi:uncharacterized protein (DUF433 family)
MIESQADLAQLTADFPHCTASDITKKYRPAMRRAMTELFPLSH